MSQSLLVKWDPLCFHTFGGESFVFFTSNRFFTLLFVCFPTSSDSSKHQFHHQKEAFGPFPAFPSLPSLQLLGNLAPWKHQTTSPLVPSPGNPPPVTSKKGKEDL